MQVFRSIQDEVVVASICRAKKRLVYVAPCVAAVITSALSQCIEARVANLRVITPSVKVVYKNITVESTRDSEFLDVLKRAVPAEELEGWFQVFDAARMLEFVSC